MAFLRRPSTKKKQQDQEHITQVVVDYILAPWDQNLLKMLEAHRDELFSAAAGHVLDKLQKEAKGDKKLNLLIQERRALLARCLVDGVDLAFTYAMRLNHSDELDPRLLEQMEEKEAGLSQYMSHRPDLAAASAFNYMGQASAYLEGAGEDTDILLKAVIYYEKALDLLDPETFPGEWGNACFRLASIFLYELPSALPGDRGITNWDLSDRGIAFLTAALLGWRRDDFPVEWASAQLNLGLAYSQRLRGDRWDNIEQAIRHFRNASEIMTSTTSPEEWWLLCAGLGHAYLEFIERDQTDNVEKAISLLQNALGVCGSAASREKRATAQFYLGQAFLKRIRGERADNIEQAINYFQLALKDRAGDIDPLFWMEAQTSLGDAYACRTRGKCAENQKLAATAYQHAIQGQRLEDIPELYLATQVKLGDLNFAQQQWDEAWVAYQSAIAAMELLYRVGGTTEARQSWLRGKYDLHAKTAYCLAQLGRFDDAVTVIESGRARALGEALARDEVALDLASDQDRAAFIAVQQRIAALEARARTLLVNRTNFLLQDLDDLDAKTAHHIITTLKDQDETEERTPPDDLALDVELRELRHELDMITARIQSYTPGFTQGRPDFAEIVNIARTVDCPLVYLLTTPAGSLALIVPPGVKTLTKQYIVWLNHFGDADLSRILYYQREGQPYYLGAITESENATTLTQSLNKIWPVLDTQLMAPVIHRLTNLGHQCVVLVADAFLGLFPLPAITIDQITFTYTPSARTLRLVLKNANVRAKQPLLLLGIGNPLPNPQPLAFARIEIEEIGLLFAASARRLLFEHQATQAAVARVIPSATHLHFSCHGAWNYASALDSALFLSGDEKVTLRNLLDGSLDLSAVRLVVLSACQTGLIDVQKVPEEFIGLPAGFLQAGVPGVVGSLWPVNDLSTALLMIRFYEYHLRGDIRTGKGPMPPAWALRKAQLWLRDVTNEELAILFDSYRKSNTSPHLADIAEEQFKKYAPREPNERPFAHPYYWAGFAFYGI